MSFTATMLTRDDLDALPDDGLRHELIDGTLVMSSVPGLAHQIFTLALYRTLHAAASDTELLVLTAPFDVALGEHVVEPDILAAPVRRSPNVTCRSPRCWSWRSAHPRRPGWIRAEK